MTKKLRGLAVPSIVALVLAVAMAGTAAAATPAQGRVTRGEVAAAFQARTTGGMLNLLRGRVIAAPVRGLQHGRISFFGDATYCAADWHYLGVTLLGAGGHAAATSYLRATSVAFWIDGSPVSGTMQTAIKPFVGTGTAGQWGISRGKLLAPGALAPGAHTLHTRIVTPDFGTEDLQVIFTLDPDACG
jgi:hypothetical protein